MSDASHVPQKQLTRSAAWQHIIVAAPSVAAALLAAAGRRRLALHHRS